MKRILVAGGAGFLGTHLCRRLTDLGNEVVVIDDLSTSWMQNVLDVQSFCHHFSHASITTATDLFGATEIYNLACPASPPKYQRDPISTMMTSVVGVGRLLELAEKNDCRFLQASTSEVYGDPEVHPQSEEYRGCVNTTGPRACYDEGKRAAETLCADYHRMYGTHVQIARIFNTYGPGMHPQDGRVVSNFVRQALRGENITVYGDGSQTRSFCFVDDLVDGLIRLMENPTTFIGPVNLGNPHEFTVMDLARMVIDLCGSSSTILLKPLPEDDPRQRRPVIDKAREHLDWKPTTTLREGLGRMIDSVRGTSWVDARL